MTHTAADHSHKILTVDLAPGITVVVEIFGKLTFTDANVQALADYLEQNKTQIADDLNSTTPGPSVWP